MAYIIIHKWCRYSNIFHNHFIICKYIIVMQALTNIFHNYIIINGIMQVLQLYLCHHLPAICQCHVRKKNSKFHMRSSLARQAGEEWIRLASGRWRHVFWDPEQGRVTWGVDRPTWPEVLQWHLQMLASTLGHGDHLHVSTVTLLLLHRSWNIRLLASDGGWHMVWLPVRLAPGLLSS